jgi:hypothetical protein
MGFPAQLEISAGHAHRLSPGDIDCAALPDLKRVPPLTARPPGHSHRSGEVKRPLTRSVAGRTIDMTRPREGQHDHRMPAQCSRCHCCTRLGMRFVASPGVSTATHMLPTPNPCSGTSAMMATRSQCPRGCRGRWVTALALDRLNAISEGLATLSSSPTTRAQAATRSSATGPRPPAAASIRATSRSPESPTRSGPSRIRRRAITTYTTPTRMPRPTPTFRAIWSGSGMGRAAAEATDVDHRRDPRARPMTLFEDVGPLHRH